MQYPGAKSKALDGLNFEVKRGSFFGLLGPNGSGKTTLLSFLCGQVKGQYRKAEILGHDRSRFAFYKSKLGYAPQEIALYPTLTCVANLKFFASLLKLQDSDVERVLDVVGMTNRKDDVVSELSGGLKRRLNLAVALLNRPELLILDEPTVGVDPQSRNFIFEQVLELKKQGTTLIYSTHYLEEIRRLCDDVAILQNGKLLEIGSVNQVLGTENVEKRYLDLTGRAVE